MDRLVAGISHNDCRSISAAARSAETNSYVRGRRHVLCIYHFVVSDLFTGIFLIFLFWAVGDVSLDAAEGSEICGFETAAPARLARAATTA